MFRKNLEKNILDNIKNEYQQSKKSILQYFAYLTARCGS